MVDLVKAEGKTAWLSVEKVQQQQDVCHLLSPLQSSEASPGTSLLSSAPALCALL